MADKTFSDKSLKDVDACPACGCLVGLHTYGKHKACENCRCTSLKTE